MTINRISRLRGCGVFNDFGWSGELLDFSRYNVIYGWNGSGKTTISRSFRSLEMKAAPALGEVTLSINGREIKGDAFHEQSLAVRVFNRDFVYESIFPVGGGGVPPIYVVGKEGVDKQREADALKVRHTAALINHESAREAARVAERDYDNHCISRAQTIKEVLRSSGANSYSNYNKSDYRNRTETMIVDGDAAIQKLTETDHDKLLAQTKAAPKPRLQLLTYQFPALSQIGDAAASLLSTTIVSATIQALKDDSQLSDWVHAGLGLHRDRNSEQCLFCEQQLPNARLATLEAHFSTEYELLLEQLDTQVALINAALQAMSVQALPNRAELYDDLASEYDAANLSVQNTFNATKAFLDSITQALSNKKRHPFESLVLPVAIPGVDADAIPRLNDILQRHNHACNDFQARVSAARQRLEAHYVAIALGEFVRLVEALRSAAGAEKQAGDEVGRLKEEIDRLERLIVEYREPAEELNEDLHKYLGHNELRLEVKETGYSINRNGEPALALSEGEMTAIALLYFLKSLKDKRFDLARGVVVLDDPVSSLDANALYLAFGFIRERCENAAQILILTHNFSLFRQVRNWFHNLKGQRKKTAIQRPARFYMLECVHDGARRCSSIRPIDPLLEQYESEYHYLFARIFREANAAAPAALEQNFAFPNIARRLLETFLAFRQPQISGELWQKLRSVEFDEAKKLRIIRFLHTYSHGDAIGEPEHDPVLLAETPAVLKNLLELMENQDPKHYEAMIGLLDPKIEQESGE